MEYTKDGGAAFPSPNNVRVGDFVSDGHEGMSLRDYFAAKAMRQLLYGAVLPPGLDASEPLYVLSVKAYEVADAMLEARK